MQLTQYRLGHLVHALAEILTFNYPADAVLSRYFRHHHELGQSDRAFLAETVYAALRRKRLLDVLVEPLPRRAVTRWRRWRRLQGLVRELRPFLEEEETPGWSAKGVALDTALGQRADCRTGWWSACRTSARKSVLARGMHRQRRWICASTIFPTAAKK
jgi:16S rRNA (cytosine967-C5)-methyltransferase